jgi:hypothetical protein
VRTGCTFIFFSNKKILLNRVTFEKLGIFIVKLKNKKKNGKEKFKKKQQRGKVYL